MSIKAAPEASPAPAEATMQLMIEVATRVMLPKKLWIPPPSALPLPWPELTAVQWVIEDSVSRKWPRWL
jgi:hypothetical protein